MKNKFIHIILILFITQVLYAQGGPIYSRYGIGDQIHSHSARRLGFGDLGSAIIDKEYADGYNPAAWTNLSLTRFGISGKFISSNYSDQNGSSRYDNAIFSGLTLGFPIDRDLGISFALGLIPVSALKYEVNESLSDSTLGNLTNSYKGSGSVSKIFVGASTLLPFNFSFGAMLEYYSGTNNYETTQKYSTSSRLNEIYYNTKFKYSGLGGTISLISGNIIEYFNDETELDLRLSTMVNFAPNLYTDTSLVSGTSIGELTPREGESTTHLPSKLTFGAILGLDKEYLILLDYIYQPWTKYTFNDKYEENFRDLMKLSLGMQYKPNITRLNVSAWEQISLRFGLSYEETQYSFNGIGIDQYSVHAGASFPFGTVNLLDLSLAYGIRGKNENNLVKEQFIKAALTLSLGELWFQREER